MGLNGGVSGGDGVAVTLTRLLRGYDYAAAWFDSTSGTRAPKACYDGQISPAPSDPIDTSTLLADFPDLARHFRCISPDFLKQHATEQSGRMRGPTNALLTPLVPDLLNGHIAEPAPRQDSKASPRPLYSGAFTVAKKRAGFLRFILSCKQLNLCLASVSLPPCHLPSYAEIIDTMMRNTLFCDFDFANFFSSWSSLLSHDGSSPSGRETRFCACVAWPWATRAVPN